MGKHRTWFSLLSYCTLMAVGAALLFAIVVAGGSVALASHQGNNEQEATDLSAQQASELPGSETQAATRFSGMITDSRCRARHMRKSNQTAEECARACYRKGASYVLVDGSRTYMLIGGDEALNKLVGQRVTVTGRQQADSILVDSAVPQI